MITAMQAVHITVLHIYIYSILNESSVLTEHDGEIMEIYQM